MKGDNEWLLNTLLESLQGLDIDLDKNSEKVERLVSEAIQKSLPKTSRILLTSLKSNAPEMLEEHRLMRQEFEARLLRRWSKPLNLLEMLIVISIESADMYVSDIQEKTEDYYVLEVLTKAHARACQISNEILTLLKSGYADGALARWRTIHELSIICNFISKHGNNTAKRYLEYEAIENYHEMVEFQKKCDILGYEPISNQGVKEISDIKEKLCASYGKDFNENYGWAADLLPKHKRNLRGLEEIIGLDHLRPYYKLACNYVHSGPKGMSFKLGIIDNEVEPKLMLCGASNYGLSDPGQNTCISLSQITACLLTIEPTYEMLMTANAMSIVCNEICDEFVKVQQEIEAEESEELKNRVK